MLLILALLVSGQYVALQLFSRFEIEPRAQAIALQVVSTVNLTRLALLAAHDSRRPALLRELNLREGIRVYPFDPFEEIEPLPEDPLLQRIADKVQEELGEGTVLAINHLGVNGLWVSFAIGPQDFWVVIPSVDTERPFPWEWVGWGALVVTLSVFGAWLIMGRINKPLNNLAQAADAIGRGESIDHLEEMGAEEFARVSHAVNEMSQAINRTDADRSLLLGGVSHDLRTPLARLRLAVEMLPDASDLKAGMEQDIDDMDGIIGQFVDFVRGGEGEAAHVGDLNALVDEVAQRYLREGKQLSIELNPLPEFRIFHLAMKRLISNLVDNAYHYGQEPGKIVTRSEEGKIILSVIDHGPGLPEVEVERLLRPFERLDVARGREGSAGLGLSIVSRIARLHHGELLLRNLEAGGLEARIEIQISVL